MSRHLEVFGDKMEPAAGHSAPGDGPCRNPPGQIIGLAGFWPQGRAGDEKKKNGKDPGFSPPSKGVGRSQPAVGALKTAGPPPVPRGGGGNLGPQRAPTRNPGD